MTPFCFMVMPFGRKPTQAEPGKGPAEINFNGLWDKAYFPLLEELGYKPIRADQETGSLIINQMLERLYFSDLVLVDITIPNGNVYYELGVRHAAQRDGCVLLAADWSKQLFDIVQMRTVRYPMPEGDVSDEQAKAIRDTLRDGIVKMRSGQSPVYEVLPGYPADVDEAKATGVRDQVDSMAAFQARMRTLRTMPPEMRKEKVKEACIEFGAGPGVHSVAIGLLRLLVSTIDDTNDWQGLLSYIEGMNPEFAKDPYVREQRALALGKLNRPDDAITELNLLIEGAGATSEREGLLGGRYKELMRAALKAGRAAEARYFRNQAIDHYERGMTLDLNDYYPSSNLPRLYRARNDKGDEARAQTALHVTIAACERALKRGAPDEWARPTLLGSAFDLADADQAELIVELVEKEGGDLWKLDTTVSSIAESLPHVNDAAVKLRLQAVVTRLQKLRPQPAGG